MKDLRRPRWPSLRATSTRGNRSPGRDVRRLGHCSRCTRATPARACGIAQLRHQVSLKARR
jgi:hypothetical protein